MRAVEETSHTKELSQVSPTYPENICYSTCMYMHLYTKAHMTCVLLLPSPLARLFSSNVGLCTTVSEGNSVRPVSCSGTIDVTSDILSIALKDWNM